MWGASSTFTVSTSLNWGKTSRRRGIVTPPSPPGSLIEAVVVVTAPDAGLYVCGLRLVHSSTFREKSGKVISQANDARTCCLMTQRWDGGVPRKSVVTAPGNVVCPDENSGGCTRRGLTFVQTNAQLSRLAWSGRWNGV